MSLAIKEAIKAKNKNEVPVGALIVSRNGCVIAKAHNLVEKRFEKNTSDCEVSIKLEIDSIQLEEIRTTIQIN